MKLSLVLLLFISSLRGLAQDLPPRVQELEKNLASATTDSARCKIMYNLYTEYSNFDVDKSTEYANRIFTLAEKGTDKYCLLSGYRLHGSLKIAKGQYLEARTALEKGLERLNADSIQYKNNTYIENEFLAIFYNDIGQTYDYQSNFTQSIKYYSKAIAIYTFIGHEKKVATVHNNLGISYLYLGDYEKSETEFQTTYLYFIKADSSRAYQAKMNLAIIETYKGNTDDAIQIYQDCISAFEKMGNLQSIGYCVSNLSEIYEIKNQLDSAIYFINRGIEIDLTLQNRVGLGVDYGLIGKLYLKKGQLKEANAYFLNALDIANETKSKSSLRSAYLNLSQLNREKGDYKKALEYFEVAKVYQDSINSENNLREVGKAEAEIAFNSQLAIQDAENQKRLEVEAQKRKQLSIIIYFSIAIFIVIAFFVYMVLKSLRIAREQKLIAENAKGELEEKNTEITDSIRYAKRIQDAILPSQQITQELLPNSFVLYKPKDIVAGDFYWIEPFNTETGENGVLFAAADCTGHGVPGAMVSVICNNGLNRSVREKGRINPGEILTETRKIIISEFEKSQEEVKDGMDIALCSLVKNATGTKAKLKYAGANNPLWLIREGSTEIEEIKADKQPIGKYAYSADFKTHEVELDKGDAIYIFSDGYADQFGGAKGKKFKGANLKKLLLSVQGISLDRQKDKLNNQFEEWRGNLEQIDDVCIIGVKI